MDRQQERINLREASEIAERMLGRKCKDCNGTGQLGYNLTEKCYIKCDCVLKAERIARREKAEEQIKKRVSLAFREQKE